jgi:hypothetical protein
MLVIVRVIVLVFGCMLVVYLIIRMDPGSVRRLGVSDDLSSRRRTRDGAGRAAQRHVDRRTVQEHEAGVMARMVSS